LILKCTTIALAAAALACVPEPAELDVNVAPVARVVVPQLWPASVPATIDGSLSDDDDGDPLRFVVDWGDGTPAAEDDDGIAQHVYGAPGTFALELVVEDPAALSSRVQASVVIVGDDDSGCSCELGCFDDAVCTTGGCLLFRSALDDDEAPETAFDPLDC
jgi:hypothetical protein